MTSSSPLCQLLVAVLPKLVRVQAELWSMLRKGELLQLWQVAADYDLHLKTVRSSPLCLALKHTTPVCLTGSHSCKGPYVKD